MDVNVELPLVSIVVAFKESESCVLDCIRSILDMDYPPDRLEVIAVDDSHDDNIARAVSQQFPEVKLIRNVAPLGCDGSKQFGMDAAAGDIIATTDADCTVDRRWAKIMAKNLTNGADVVTGPVRHPKTFIRELIGIADFQDFQGDTHRHTSAFPGCNVAARKTVLREAGYRSTGALRFGSDRLTSWQMHMRGYRIAYDPGMVVYHSPSVNLSSLMERRLRYGRKALLLRRLDSTLPGSIISRLGLLSALAYICYKSPKDAYHLICMAAHRIVNPWHVPLLLLPLIAFRIVDALGMLQAQRRSLTSPIASPESVRDSVPLP